MNMTQVSPSHARDLVAELVHDDPNKAEVLIKLFALSDGGTPKGAAIRTDAMMFAYSFTDDCRKSMERFIAA